MTLDVTALVKSWAADDKADFGLALKRAEDETGQYVIYAPHITTTPEHLLENAQFERDKGILPGDAVQSQ